MPTRIVIFEHNKKTKDKAALIEEIRWIIRASIGNRAKERLVVDFISATNLDDIPDKRAIIDACIAYAQERQRAEAAALIADERLYKEPTRRYLETSLRHHYASQNGTALNSLLPKMSPLNPQYLTPKQRVFQRIADFVETFKGVGKCLEHFKCSKHSRNT